jgi:hypothetical protein
MTLAKAKAQAKAKVKHIYSTGVIYDRHLQSSKYFYKAGHRTTILSHKMALFSYYAMCHYAQFCQAERLFTESHFV